jgi:hypothetical protein
VFAPLKAAYCEQVKQLERRGVNTISKEHFTLLFGPERGKAFTAKNIKAGFAASSLFPFNLDRVLNSMLKPTSETPISKAEKVTIETRRLEQVPHTPITPVLAEGLMTLQNLIIKQDAHALDETSKQSLKRHVQKFAKAAHISFAKGAL